jgi:branched-chain amino acid transport system permease protein
VAFLDTLVSIAFTGAAFAMVLYVISVGLSITMGLLGIANLAHGAFAMFGGYVAYGLVNQAGVSFLPSLLAAALSIAAISVVLERFVYARVYSAGELDQVLLSIGLIFVSIAVAHFAFGPLPLAIELPGALRGQMDFGWRAFPAYRVFLIGIGLAAFAGLWFGVERTGLGARIRAAVDNRDMAEAVGINTRRLFTLVFALGSALAALGGALGTEVIALTPGYPLEYLVYFLIVVAVGGLGSIKGPFFAALLLGFGDAACKILIPQFGAFFIYVSVFLLLLWRPAGLFGRA